MPIGDKKYVGHNPIEFNPPSAQAPTATAALTPLVGCPQGEANNYRAPLKGRVLFPSRSHFGNTTGSHSLSHPSTVLLVRSSLRSWTKDFGRCSSTSMRPASPLALSPILSAALAAACASRFSRRCAALRSSLKISCFSNRSSPRSCSAVCHMQSPALRTSKREVAARCTERARVSEATTHLWRRNLSGRTDFRAIGCRQDEALIGGRPGRRVAEAAALLDRFRPARGRRRGLVSPLAQRRCVRGGRCGRRR